MAEVERSTPTSRGSSRSNARSAQRTAARGGSNQAASTALATTEDQGLLTSLWEQGTAYLGRARDQIVEGATAAWDATQEAAAMALDLWGASDVGYEDGVYSASTDLDAVMPFLPESVRNSVLLQGAPSANQVGLRLDSNTGKLQLTVPDLEVGSVDLGGASAAGLRLRGMVLTIDDAAALGREAAEEGLSQRLRDWVFGSEPVTRANAMHLRVQSLEADGVQADGVTLGRLRASELLVDLSSADAGLLGMEDGPAGVSVSFQVGRIEVEGAAAGDTRLDSASLQDLQLKADPAQQAIQAQLGLAQVAGLETGDQSVGALSARDLHAVADANGTDVSTNRWGLDLDPERMDASASFGNAELSRLQVPGVDVRGAQFGKSSGRLKPGGGFGQFGSVAAQGVGVAGLTSEELFGRRLAVDVDAGGNYIGFAAGSLGYQGLDLGSVTSSRGSFQGVDSRNVLTGANEHYRGTVKSGTAYNLKSGDTSVGQTRVSDAAWRYQGGTTSVDARTAAASDYRSGGLKIDQLGASDLHVGADADQVAVRAQRARLGHTASDHTSFSGATAKGLNAQVGLAEDRLSADAEQLAVDQLKAVAFSAGSVQGQQVHYQQQDDRYQAQVGTLRGDDVLSDRDGSRIGVDRLDGQRVTLAGSDNGVDLGASQLRARQVAFQQDLGKAEALPASDGPTELDLGPTSVELDGPTTASARMKVQRGDIIPSATKASLDRPLDGPLWVDVEGGELKSAGQDRMTVHPQLSGAPDLNIAKYLPGGKDTVPTDLTGFTEALGAKDVARYTSLVQSADVKATVPLQALGGSAPLDLARLQASGSVGLGGAMALDGVTGTLQSERPGDNQLGVEMNGVQNVAVTFIRMLVSGLRVDLESTTMSASRAAASGGQVSLGKQGDNQVVGGQIGQVDLKDLKTEHRF